MRSVLFSWELGRGAGHLANIRRMARLLRRPGVRIVAAVPDPAAAAILAELCDEVVKTPAWPPRGDGPADRSSATFGDILAACGLADVEAVRRVLNEWRGLFDAIAPDLLVADLAPGSALAARGRIPTVLVGNGFTLPPADLPTYPLLHQGEPPQWSEERMLDAINRALVSVGNVRIAALPQIFEAEARCVQTFALLDPYNAVRNELLCGPLFEEQPPLERSPSTNSIFVYLSADYPLVGDLVDALQPFGRQARIYAQRLPDTARHALSDAGADILTGPVPLAPILRSSRLVIHTGGGGVAAEALAAGAPQLIISQQIEQDINGRALANAGVGRCISGSRPGSFISAKMITEIMSDKDMSRRANELGLLHRQILLAAQPAARFEQVCAGLLS